MKGEGVRHLLSCWTTKRARRSGTAIAFLLAAAVTGCGDSTGPSEPTTPVGSYTIATVNGKALPASVFADGPINYEVMSGKLSLTSDGKYSAVTTFRQTVPGDVSTYVDSIGGTWVLSGTTVQMINTSDASTGSATWANRQLTIVVVDGKVTTTFVYGLTK